MTCFERRRIKLELPKFIVFTELYEVLPANTQEVASPRVHQLNPRKYRANRTIGCVPMAALP
jgi:hypothetical protein